MTGSYPPRLASAASATVFGSDTVTAVASAPSSFARAKSRSTALAAGSEPSLAKRTCLNIACALAFA